MRCTTLLLALLCQALPALACTAFTVSQDGRSFIGCNEDAWSINANVRMEQGRIGDYGAIYFAHYNGHPLRAMIDQIGMNEMGLMYDGLGIQPKEVQPTPGLKALHFSDLMPLVLRSCATVQEAAAMLRNYDHSILPSAMIFMADQHGGYLIVENDTIIEGHDPWFAVGNWRMGQCADPSAIPIPRLQRGRALLTAGSGASYEEARDVLKTMTACRDRMGEGTLFSVLFEPTTAKAHLYFYHDFSEVVTFDLKEELAKGDRTVDMATLFGPRPEYDRLLGYLTPFHHRWLFWTLLALAGIAGIVGCIALYHTVRAVIGRIRNMQVDHFTPIMAGLASAITITLIGVLLMQEGVYYFGLADVATWFAWLPLVLFLFTAYLFHRAWAARMQRTWPLWCVATTLLPFLALLGYWGMLLP